MKSYLINTVRLREYLKYFRNVCCVMTNHGKDQETQASHKTVWLSFFFLVMQHSINSFFVH